MVQMKCGKLFDTLQNLIHFKPKVSDIAQIIGVSDKTLYARAKRDSGFSDEEIRKIEEFYCIDLSGNTNDDCVELEHIHIKPSCGKGTIVLDDAEITPVKLGKAIISNILKISKPEFLKTFRASGDSMESVIEDGDILLVDTGRTDFQNGGIFLLTINNDWFVKRLRLRVTGELDIISDNEKYPTETLKPDCGIEVEIKGRVVKNLSRGL